MKETVKLESVRIRGFRSLADVELSDLGATSVLIGPNGSGKSNFIRFFDMLNWMLRSSRLGEFVERHGAPMISCSVAAAQHRAWGRNFPCGPTRDEMIIGSPLPMPTLTVSCSSRKRSGSVGKVGGRRPSGTAFGTGTGRLPSSKQRGPPTRSIIWNLTISRSTGLRQGSLSVCFEVARSFSFMTRRTVPTSRNDGMSKTTQPYVRTEEILRRFCSDWRMKTIFGLNPYA